MVIGVVAFTVLLVVVETVVEVVVLVGSEARLSGLGGVMFSNPSHSDTS